MHRKAILIPCRCGCGTLIPDRDRYGVPHYWVPNHDKVLPLGAALAKHVDQDPTPGVCWLRKDGRAGYWQLSHRNKARAAHRVAWELASGEPIPEGFDCCHVCDTPACTRNEPSGTHEVDGVTVISHGHLFLGTDKLNNRDKVAKRRQAYGERNGGALLSAADVDEIRTLHATGLWTYQGLADTFGISRSQVGHVVRHESWRLPLDNSS